MSVAFVCSFNEVVSDITTLETTSIPNIKTLDLFIIVTLYPYVFYIKN